MYSKRRLILVKAAWALLTSRILYDFWIELLSDQVKKETLLRSVGATSPSLGKNVLKEFRWTFTVELGGAIEVGLHCWKKTRRNLRGEKSKLTVEAQWSRGIS